MQQKRKIKLLLAFIALIICITQISQTYAKYIETKEGDTSFTIAQWKVLVNNQDISETTTMSSLISPIYIDNENIKEGVIAPGSEGYFDIEIDANNVEVSFLYNITIGSTEESSVQDLKITGYSQNESAIIPLVEETNNISDTIYYNQSEKNIKLRIYFSWIEGEGETMNNQSDTNAALSGKNGKLKINLSFIQTLN